MIHIIMVLALAAPIVLLPTHGDAQRPPIRLDCVFDRAAIPKEGIKKLDKLFEMSFVVDSTTEKAFTIGNAGVNEVELETGSNAVTFLEALETGVVQSTTIVLDTMEAVHSRHTIILSILAPSQYYGSCSTLTR